MAGFLFAPENTSFGPPLARCSECPAFQRVLLIQETAGVVGTGLGDVLCQNGCRVEIGSRKALDDVNELDYEFVLWDTQRPQHEEMAALRRCRQRCPKLPVLVLADGASAETAIELVKAGAFDLIAKPYASAQLQKALERALKARRLLCDAVLIPCAAEPGCSVRRLVGRGPAMQEVYKQIGLVAERDEPVLIRGETGTGKELVARAIHYHSRRKDQPFLAVNCAAIPEPLLESELFGHEKGSFTGATQRRLGAFEQADRGTLFLDEVGDMPRQLQAKILRVLQQREIQRVGSNETGPVDVRILAATNKVLETAILAGTFREDLYYRLQVVSIRVPPLREHSDDIPELAEHFVGCYTPAGEPRPALEELALQALQAHHWPGNVRELENTMRRALVLAKGHAIMEKNIVLGDSPHPNATGMVTHAHPMILPLLTSACGVATCGHDESPEEHFDRVLQHWLAQQAKCPAEQMDVPIPARIERKLLQAALRQTRGNQVRAARLLGISRTTLRNWLKKHSLRVDPGAGEG